MDSMIAEKKSAREIFVYARALHDSVEQQAYLDYACNADSALRKKVEDLLAECQVANDNPLDLVVAALGVDQAAIPSTPQVEDTQEIRPQQIGPYKLLEQIGQGGFGTVYLAEQSTPVKRRVALKILKPGMDSKEVMARFDVERQALAMMDHPNIAKVFDAGTAPSGRPYFVMELVRGLSITRYCDDAHLTTERRLHLFVQVCRAVQHAHQKGIIHRDIKPSNILITLHDGVPMPKVIDFGVAKALNPEMGGHSVYTKLTQLIGTPLYMSPEQANLSAVDVDTRTDVYSLGVLLYELLSGMTPFDPLVIQNADFDEMRRMIREEEPSRPSTRLSTLDAKTCSTVSSKRGIDHRQLIKLLSGDLDWIVMKALEKDRNRRYESAGAFAADIERYLIHEPVEARPPTTAYRLQKFARRNWAALTTAAAMAFLLIAGIAVSWRQAVRAIKAEKNAIDALAQTERARQEEAQQRQRAEENERQAKIEAATALEIKEFLQLDVLDLATARSQQSAEREGLLKVDPDLKVRDLVVRAAKKIDGRFHKLPLVEAELRTTLGLTLGEIGRFPLAVEQFSRVREINSAVLGPTHQETLRSMTYLAEALANAGRVKEAMPLSETALRLMKETLGPDHEDTLVCMNARCHVLRYANVHDEVLKLSKELYELTKGKLGQDNPRTMKYLSNLSVAYATMGRRLEAIPLQEQVLEYYQNKLGRDDIQTLNSMANLAAEYSNVGRIKDAIPLMEETLKRQKAILGVNHRKTLLSMSNLAITYGHAGRNRESLLLYEEMYQRLHASFGPDHPGTVHAQGEWVYALVRTSDPALRDTKRAIELAEAAVKKFPENAKYRDTLGMARYSAGDWKAAAADFKLAIDLRQAHDPWIGTSALRLAQALWQLGEKDQAREWYAKGVQWLKKGDKEAMIFKRLLAETAKMLEVKDQP